MSEKSFHPKHFFSVLPEIPKPDFSAPVLEGQVNMKLHMILGECKFLSLDSNIYHFSQGQNQKIQATQLCLAAFISQTDHTSFSEIIHEKKIAGSFFLCL